MTQEMVHNNSTSPDRSATIAKFITVKNNRDERTNDIYFVKKHFWDKQLNELYEMTYYL